ncbi:MAG: hypothetical protein AB4206_05435 [Xenococcaceae cyanobacterium]
MSGVLVDTCMWSLALRGKTPRNQKVAEELTILTFLLHCTKKADSQSAININSKAIAINNHIGFEKVRQNR